MTFQVPMWIAIQWHISLIVSLQIISSNGILVIANKWVQGIYHFQNSVPEIIKGESSKPSGNLIIGPITDFWI